MYPVNCESSFCCVLESSWIQKVAISLWVATGQRDTSRSFNVAMWRQNRAFLVPLLVSQSFLAWVPRPPALPRRVARSASKRELLHQRHVTSSQELLKRLESGKVKSLMLLCGATAGNLGAILRSSTLLEIDAVCILGQEEPSKATLDKAFRFSMLEQRNHWDTLVVPVALKTDDGVPGRFLLDLKEKGVKLVGMVAGSDPTYGSETCDLWDLDLSTEPVAFVFGTDEEDGSAFTKEARLVESETPLPWFFTFCVVRLNN